MRRIDRVLISAFIGSDNLGDEAVFLSLAAQLATRLKDCRLTAVSTKPGKTRRLLAAGPCDQLAGIRVTRRVWLPVAIARSDTCIFGGGGIIQDQSSILNLVYFLLQIHWARLLGKKVVLAFVGVGPVQSRFGRAWLRTTLSGISACIVRDEQSKALMQKLGVAQTRIDVGADIALNLDCRPVASEAPRRGYRYVLISLRHWYDQERVFTPAFLKSRGVRQGGRLDTLLDALVHELGTVLDREQDLRIVAAPLYGRRDEIVHRELFSRFESRYRHRLILSDPVSDPCEYLGLAESAECIVAMRLHALILGSLRAVPLVALSYSSKVAAFMRQLNLDENVLDVEWEPDVRSLADTIAVTLAGSPPYRYRIDDLVRRNSEAIDILRRVIDEE